MSTTNPQPEDSILLVKREGFVATLTFNRPVVLNAIDVPMARALRDASRQCACDRSIRAIVLCGAGNGFMAGGDLATLSADPAQGASDLLDPLNEALTHFANMDAPLIAKVHGVAAGAGMSLMMQADFVVAAEKTRFNLAYINIGASCDVGASWFLPRQVGLRRALEISMLGETMQVDEALRIGLVNRVVPAAELDADVMALAHRLAAGPTVALGHMRRLMRSSLDRDLPEQLEAEKAAFLDCAQSRDFRSGVDAFFAKQPAQFLGH